MKFLKPKSTQPIKVLQYKETELTRMIDQYNKFWFLCCYPNVWVKKVDFPDLFIKVYRTSMIFNHLVMIIFSLSCIMSLWTQHDLSPSQEADRAAFAVPTPFVTVFYHFVILFYNDAIREVLYKLTVVLKKDHNDKTAEKGMIKQSKFFSSILFSSCVYNMVVSGLTSLVKVVTSDATFITCPSAWPDIQDRSTLASLTRIVVYFLWIFHIFRTLSVFLIIHTVLLCLSQQYKNLQSYFESLNKIFDEKELSQTEKELMFEVKFKMGIQQHALTLWCVNKTQQIFQIIFSFHVLLWCGLLISILPSLMNSEIHSMLVSNAPKIATSLVFLGYFMWPAGDVTVEASNLSKCIYGSGWWGCHDSSSRIRKLVVLAMMQAQRPVELKAFGQFTYCYENYVSIVKTSYSLFSILY